jgi:hypothetical protein
MRHELESRRQEVTSLKGSLTRRKVSDKRVCEQLEKSWEDRLAKRSKEHRAAVERQDEFIQQLGMSINTIKSRGEGLKEVLQCVRVERTGAERASERSGRASCSDERSGQSKADERAKRLSEAGERSGRAKRLPPPPSASSCTVLVREKRAIGGAVGGRPPEPPPRPARSHTARVVKAGGARSKGQCIRC